MAHHMGDIELPSEGAKGAARRRFVLPNTLAELQSTPYSPVRRVFQPCYFNPMFHGIVPVFDKRTRFMGPCFPGSWYMNRVMHRVQPSFLAADQEARSGDSDSPMSGQHAPIAQDVEYKMEDSNFGSEMESIEEFGSQQTGEDSNEDELTSSPPLLLNNTSGFDIKVDTAVNKGVVRAAKTLFSKRTRTLCHWLYPDKSKRRLKATVSSAWDTLPEKEKNVYIAQVLGRFGNQSTALMVNPQLNGITRYAHESSCEAKMVNEEDNAEVDREEVKSILAEYDNKNCWNYYPRRQEYREIGGRRKWRMVSRKQRGPNAMLPQGELEEDPPEPFCKRDDTDEHGKDVWLRSPETMRFMTRCGI